MEELVDGAAKPFLKWAGGKTRLMAALRPYFPDSFENYHEPFLGGGAVFFAAGRQARSKAFLSDLNADLIHAWQAVKERPEELLQEFLKYEGANTEDAYYAIRDSESPRGQIALAARFIYLNQTAWNGLWRVNRNGVFNVPWGARPFRGITKNDLASVSNILRRTEVRNEDFRDALCRPKRGDFVYIDPPYLPISDTSKFSGYTEKRFCRADLCELSELCRALTRRGVRWVLSNRDNELIRDVFSHARIIAIKTRRSVAAQNRRDIEPVDSPEAIIVSE